MYQPKLTITAKIALALMRIEAVRQAILDLPMTPVMKARLRETSTFVVDSLFNESDLPCPLRAAVAHYQFATIHPYYDGNGKTARLLTTLVLHIGGYDLKGFYSLEEYYARDLPSYYNALAVGPSHNFYMGRADADITGWVEYFCSGMVDAFESVHRRAKDEAHAGQSDKSQLLRQLDARQRKVIGLFRKADWITSAQVEKILAIKGRTARYLCQQWVESGFLVFIDAAKKTRKYALNQAFLKIIE